ncbi:MAG: methylenetetrahydrofolate reductase [NAD(P)H] [Betaproteobacteria bacterium]|jgi:methylenetetrahydrofolate reductase (NADPH)|nr:MAG: methylenetetrahydrofolate reductase [NAD(P)H] [Betaproteobacteria bacterium]
MPLLSLSLSFEFFPPQTPAGVEKLRTVRRRLAKLSPEYFSVTFGAGGSTRERTRNIVVEISDEGLPVAPHVSCIASTRANIKSMLDEYQAHGLRRLVALRGDLPSGMAEAGEFRFASELVEFIRAEYADAFHIEVGAYPEYHPQSRSALDDLLNFKRKVDAGADSAITQYFFNADAYFHFRDQCTALGVAIPIFPGIMPIGRFRQLARFSDACGAEIPRWIRRKLESYADDDASSKAFGLDVVTQLCERLLANEVPGLHFYTMNQADAACTICERLGLSAGA